MTCPGPAIRAALLILLILGSAGSADAIPDAAAAGPGGTPCNDIPADHHWTGLVFNPPGEQTGYFRSRCLQQAAVTARELRLCDKARERQSWWFDGSGTSPAACARAVQQRITEDVAAARELRDIQRPTRLTLYRNGNGRDVDVVVETSGSSGAGLWLTLEVIGDDGRAHTLRSERQPMDEAPGELVLLVQAAEIARALGSSGPGQPVTVRATLARRLLTADDRAVHAQVPQFRLASSIEQRLVPNELMRAPLTRP